MNQSKEKEWKIYTLGPTGLNLYGEADTRREAVAIRQKAGLEMKNSGNKVVAYSASGQVKIGIHLK